MIEAAYDRYVRGHRERRPIEVWKFNRQVTTVAIGTGLRIQANSPFLLHWTSDEWLHFTDGGSWQDRCKYGAAPENERGLHSGEGHRFCARYIARIQRCCRLRSRYDRLRAKGLLTLPAMAELLGISMDQVKTRRYRRK